MQRQKQSTPALQRYNQAISPVVQEMYWIKDNSTSIKAKNQANKSITAFEKAIDHAERAVTLQDQKESKSTEQQSLSQTRQRTQRFASQES